jgi:hypothetical protein
VLLRVAAVVAIPLSLVAAFMCFVVGVGVMR